MWVGNKRKSRMRLAIDIQRNAFDYLVANAVISNIKKKCIEVAKSGND